jgi:phage/plasmid-associated DNA primase
MILIVSLTPLVMKISSYYILLSRNIPCDSLDFLKSKCSLESYYDVSDILMIEDAIHKEKDKSFPEIFNELCTIKGEDDEVFKIFFVVKRKFVICEGITYMFSNHSWIPLNNPKLTSIYLENYFQDDLKTYGVELGESPGKNLSSEILLYLSSEKFSELLNKRNFIRFNNGVYDVDKMVFRDGLPSDFITLSTDISFFDNFNPDLERDLDDFLDKVFPDSSVKHYFLCYMASCLEGKNRSKIFSIWSGVGNNGKSAMISLVENSFGSYVCKSPTSLFTGRRTGSSSATPELLSLEDKLISFVQESDTKENMNVGTLKELTGNDTIYARGLYSTPKNIVIKSKFILVTNRVYSLTGADNAAWARIKVIPFESSFLKENEFKKLREENSEKLKVSYIMDTRFIDKVKKLAPVFMRRLIKYYENSRNEIEGYECENLPYCEKVEVNTEALKFQNSPVTSFVKNMLELKENSYLSLELVFNEFRIWVKQYHNIKSYKITDFANDLKRLDITLFDDNVIGYKMNKKIFKN